jgi:hypothetical protein
VAKPQELAQTTIFSARHRERGGANPEHPGPLPHGVGVWPVVRLTNARVNTNTQFLMESEARCTQKVQLHSIGAKSERNHQEVRTQFKASKQF